MIEEIRNKICNALRLLYSSYNEIETINIEINRTTDKSHGDFYTNIAMKRSLSSPLFLILSCWTSLYIAVTVFEKIGYQQDIVDTNLERFYCLAAISFESLGILINLLIYRKLKEENYRKNTKKIFLFINVMSSLALFFCLPALFLISLAKFLGSFN